MKTNLTDEVLLSVYKSIRAQIRKLKSEKKLVVKELKLRKLDYD